jgi:Sap, sulfolipid-1-addressing protein
VPLQAIPLALIASLYPFGLAALFVLLQATRPRARAVVFLAGAAVCTLAVGFLFVFVLRDSGDSQNSQQTPRDALALGIGIAFLIGAWIVAHHAPKPKSDGEPSRITRAASGSGLLAVFIVGIAMYTPSPTYLAALEVISSTKLSAAMASLWVIIVVLLLLITIEIPILLFWFAPGWTVPRLSRLNDWLAQNGRTLFAVVLAVLGVWEVIRGLTGLL